MVVVPHGPAATSETIAKEIHQRMVGRQQQQIRDELFGSDDSETTGWSASVTKCSKISPFVLLFSAKNEVSYCLAKLWANFGKIFIEPSGHTLYGAWSCFSSCFYFVVVVVVVVVVVDTFAQCYKTFYVGNLVVGIFPKIWFRIKLLASGVKVWKYELNHGKVLKRCNEMKKRFSWILIEKVL